MSPSTSTTVPLDVVCPTRPDRITVSTPTEIKRATLFLTFRRPAGAADVRCRSVTVTLPVGTGAAHLLSSTEAAPADDVDDYPVDSAGIEWAVERRTTPPNPGAPGEVTTITFTCTPATPSGDTVFGANREFTLILSQIPVNRTPGAAPLTVTVSTSRNPTGTPQWDDHTIGLPSIEKAGNEFYLRNFSSTTPRVGYDRTATLTWEGTPQNTEYWLYWDEEKVKVTPTGTPLTHTTPKLTRTTTFVLDATTLNAAGQTVHHYHSTTVTVAGPAIEARTLTAADKVDVTDTFVANRTDNRKTWATTTEFSGEVTIG
ncbi:hypothetical protein [Kitasatospora sp. NPDC094011]|uniref:hypothetical protein n=1 Tax=Kitasatospora sp. NPDC094011 TaxID=3364090 RepID=UPI0037F19553